MQRDMNRLEPERYDPGVYQLPLHVDDEHQRWGAWRYVHETVTAKTPAGKPKYPLTLSTASLATRVLFKDAAVAGGKPTAYGVEYMKGKGLYSADKRYDPAQTAQLANVTARKEVIVAGGAFNTPQILKLSGIGPREELEEHGIPVVADVPAVVSPAPVPSYQHQRAWNC